METRVSLLSQELFTNQKEVTSWIEEVREGLENHEPEMVESGEGGTYFLRNAKGDCVAIFKPNDEEPFSVTNPKLAEKEPSSEGNHSSDIKQGILPGEGAYREVAAYLLDHQHFANVPTTIFVEFTYPLFNWKEKQGSLQRYVQHDCESWDIGPSEFSIADTHKIGILDLRILNVDRHGGNILAKRLDIVDKGSYELVPIDHGFSLPDSVNGTDLWFEWLTWAQSSKPFSEEELAYIAKLNVSNDANILRRLGIREACVRTMMISTTLLKLGAARRLTLAQIAKLLCRTRHYGKKKSTTTPSPIEVMAQNLPSTNSKYFLVCLESEINKVLDTHYPKKDPPTPREDRKPHNCVQDTKRTLSATCPRLESLIVSTNITENALTKLSGMIYLDLSHCKTLQGNPIPDIGKSSTLRRTLIMTGTEVMNKVFQRRDLEKQINNLQTLILDCCLHLSGQLIVHLAQVSRSIHCLSLAGNIQNPLQITDGTLITIARQLGTSLENIKLYRSNKFTDAIMAIAQHYPKLTKISLAHCKHEPGVADNPSSRNCRAIKSLVEQNQGLTVLILEWCQKPLAIC